METLFLNVVLMFKKKKILIMHTLKKHKIPFFLLAIIIGTVVLNV